MKNAVIMNNDKPISLVIPYSEAESRLKGLKQMYPNAFIERTNQEVKEKFEYKGEAEVVEDVGCAGGACTL